MWRVVAAVVVVVLGAFAWWFFSGTEGVAPGAASAEVAAGCASGKAFYASVDGTADGNGSGERPFDLTTALSSGTAVGPCDTVWVRGGTYTGAFTSTLRGREGAPITVRAEAGARVTIDSAPQNAAALTVQGPYVWFWGLEITNSDGLRSSKDEGNWPSDLRRASGVVARAGNLKFINMIVHDVTRGFDIGAEALNVEVYGSLVYYNGWIGPKKAGNGSGIDTHNKAGQRRLADNIIFDQFSHGISVYGSSPEINLNLEGNILFDNGSLAKSFGRDVLIGGAGAQAPTLTGNSTFGGAQLNIGYGAGCSGARIQGNYLAATIPLTLTDCDGTIKGNTFVGQVGPLSSTHPDNTYIAENPTGQVVRLRSNEYEQGRANVAIYNWDKRETVDIDLGRSGLSPGEEFEIRDAKNFFGPPLAKGQYQSGVAVTLPVTTQAVGAPVGTDIEAPPHEAPVFLAVVVLPVPAKAAVKP